MSICGQLPPKMRTTSSRSLPTRYRAILRECGFVPLAMPDSHLWLQVDGLGRQLNIFRNTRGTQLQDRVHEFACAVLMSSLGTLHPDTSA